MQNKSHYILAAMLCMIPAGAYANVGIPMLAVMLPIFLLALIPVVLIEAYVFKRGGLPFKWALKWSTIANLITTLVGIPITWRIMLVIREITIGGGCAPSGTLSEKILAVFMEAPWLCPNEQVECGWMVSTAFLILLIPFFFMSWTIESFIIRKKNKELDRRVLNKLCLQGNLITYGLLALFPIFNLCYALAHN